MCAVLRQRTDVVEQLVKACTHADTRDFADANPLSVAFALGDDALITPLLRAAIAINSYGRSVLLAPSPGLAKRVGTGFPAVGAELPGSCAPYPASSPLVHGAIHGTPQKSRRLVGVAPCSKMEDMSTQDTSPCHTTLGLHPHIARYFATSRAFPV